MELGLAIFLVIFVVIVVRIVRSAIRAHRYPSHTYRPRGAGNRHDEGPLTFHYTLGEDGGSRSGSGGGADVGIGGGDGGDGGE